MAREKGSALFVSKLKFDKLFITLVSSEKGAKRIVLSLRHEDNVSVLTRIFPGARIVSRDYLGLPLADAVLSVLRNRPILKKISMDIPFTPFQMRVWKATAAIPFGEKRTYGEVAGSVDNPGAARAVGGALGRNPLPLIFP